MPSFTKLLSGLGDLLKSEKAIAAGVLAVISTIFVFTNKLTVEQWMEYTQILLGIYVGGKTIQGTVSTVMSGKREIKALESKIEENDKKADAALEDRFSKDG